MKEKFLLKFKTNAGDYFYKVCEVEGECLTKDKNEATLIKKTFDFSDFLGSEMHCPENYNTGEFMLSILSGEFISIRIN